MLPNDQLTTTKSQPAQILNSPQNIQIVNKIILKLINYSVSKCNLILTFNNYFKL